VIRITANADAGYPRSGNAALLACGSLWLSKISSTIRFGRPEAEVTARLRFFWKLLNDELPEGAMQDQSGLAPDIRGRIPPGGSHDSAVTQVTGVLPAPMHDARVSRPNRIRRHAMLPRIARLSSHPTIPLLVLVLANFGFRSAKNSIFSLCLISSLLAGSAAGAVVGGQPASVGDLIRGSAVEISGPGCSGVLIGDRYVLTAAHCTAELSSLVILKSSLYQDCSTALVDDVFYPPDEKSVLINGQD
jgi:hypothetical protein